jgi:2-(1,2-epoxy-1,2-dihydrophenyl)acetyl-CoA isomerase
MSVRFEKQGNVGIVTLDREEKLNAMSEEMYQLLHLHFTETLPNDEDIRAVVLTGAGRAFCAGGDVTNMANTDVVQGRPRSKRRHRMIKAMADFEKPVIAAVRGPVVGIGTSLAMVCDITIASETAYYMFAFRKMGVVPDGGAIFFLTQTLGIQRAKELAFTARKLPAAEALAYGMCCKVVPDADLETEAMALATEMAQSATFALQITKKMFSSMYQPSLDSLLELEALASASARQTHDHKEAVTAFREKRKPKYLGR